MEFIHPAEEIVDKARNAPIPIRVRAPIVRGEDGGYGNGGDSLPLGDEVWIIRGVKIRGKIIVLELRAILDGQKLVPNVPPAFQESVDRLRRYENYAGNFSAS